MAKEPGYYNEEKVLFHVEGEGDVLLTEEEAERLASAGLNVSCIDRFGLTDLDAFDDDDDDDDRDADDWYDDLLYWDDWDDGDKRWGDADAD